MADTDSGGLLVQIGTTQARMERELAKLLSSSVKTANSMEQSFNAANSNIGKGATTAFNNFSKGANSAAPAVKNLSGYSANLASQLNDITVQLAGGQSPFQIMLQQGTQIGQIVAQAGGGFKTLGSILGSAFLSVLNPVNLLTFAVIGLGGAAVQYFSSMISGGADSEKTLEEQTKLVQEVARVWGEAVPALKEYVDNLERAKNVEDLDKVVSQRQDAVKTELQGMLSTFEELNRIDTGFLLQDANDTSAQLHDVGVAYEELREKILNGTATAEDFKKVTDSVNEANAAGVTGLGDFAVAFNSFAGSVEGSLAVLRQFVSQVGAVKNTAAAVQADLQNKIQGATQLNNGKIVQTPPSNVVLMDDGRYVETPKPSERPSPYSFSAPKSSSGGSSRKAAGADAYKNEVASINERTDALRASTAAQAEINPLVNDYGFALTKAQTEQKLLADAQKSGLEITPQLRDQISELATNYANATVESKKLSESQKQIQKNAQEWADTSKDTFKGFLSDLKDGKSGAEALSNAMKKLSDKLMDMAVDSLFSTKSTGAASTGLFSSVFSGIGKLLGFASGTANTGGKRGQPIGVVHGQEAVIPLPSGGKVPVQIASPTVQASKSSKDVVSFNIGVDSGVIADIANKQIKTASGTIVQLAVTQSYTKVKGNMSTLITDTQARSL